MTDSVKYIRNIYTEEEIKRLKEFSNSIFNSSYGNSSNNFVVKLDKGAGKKYVHMLPDMFPEDLQDKVILHAKQLNPKAELRTIIITKYAKEYGDPQLAPHFDRPSKVCFLIDYQLDANIIWPINIEGIDYEIPNNDAVVIETTKKVHWRTPLKFNEDQFVTLIFFSFEDDSAEMSNQNGHNEVIGKYYPTYRKAAEGIHGSADLLPKLIEMFSASEKNKNV